MGEEQEYIIGYNKHWCEIGATALDDALKETYKFALERHKKTEGEIVSYNNQFWCSVMAENAKDALDKFFEKFKAFTKEQKNE